MYKEHNMRIKHNQTIIGKSTIISRTIERKFFPPNTTNLNLKIAIAPSYIKYLT